MSKKGQRRPVHPGEVLREDVLPGLGQSAAEFAAALGKSPGHVGLILRERRPVTVDTAIRLSRVLGTSPEVWLRLQQAVDIYNAVRKHGKQYKRIRRAARASRLKVGQAT